MQQSVTFLHFLSHNSLWAGFPHSATSWNVLYCLHVAVQNNSEVTTLQLQRCLMILCWLKYHSNCEVGNIRAWVSVNRACGGNGNFLLFKQITESGVLFRTRKLARVWEEEAEIRPVINFAFAAHSPWKLSHDWSSTHLCSLLVNVKLNCISNLIRLWLYLTWHIKHGRPL